MVNTACDHRQGTLGSATVNARASAARAAGSSVAAIRGCGRGWRTGRAVVVAVVQFWDLSMLWPAELHGTNGLLPRIRRRDHGRRRCRKCRRSRPGRACAPPVHRARQGKSVQHGTAGGGRARFPVGTGEILVLGALARTESRGGMREDYPNRYDLTGTTRGVGRGGVGGVRGSRAAGRLCVEPAALHQGYLDDALVSAARARTACWPARESRRRSRSSRSWATGREGCDRQSGAVLRGVPAVKPYLMTGTSRA